jgi:hypothetical protein
MRIRKTRVPYPAYSPEAGPSDVFFCGHMRREMAGFAANSSKGSLFQKCRIFQEIPKRTLVAVYHEWIIEQKGDFHHVE